jgi:YidC/Oxa1 family membrane protein insertase
MENKNIIIALVLMLAVWVGGNMLFKPSESPTTSSEQNTLENKVSETGATEVREPEELVTTRENLPEVTAEEREVIVETDTYHAVFTSSGGRLKSLCLKQYREAPSEDSARVSLVDAKESDLATVRTFGLEGFDLPSEANYSLVSGEERIELGSGEERKIVFSTATPQGLRVEKVYTIRNGRYDLDLQVRVANLGGQSLRGALSLALVQPWDESMEQGRYGFVGPAILQDGKVHTHKVKELEEKAVEYGNDAVWTLFEHKYFMSAAVPLEGDGNRFRIAKVGQNIVNTVISQEKVLKPGDDARFGYLLYFGPRDLDILEKIDYQLEKAVDFGFFGIIARPLLEVLKFFYHYVGNYGVAIILLTCIIKILFWPLTHKSYQSMKSMQTLQPEMQKIREKFKEDKERMNKEIMELYKRKRVNPMGGCLPMFIQIPVFFALYKVLLGTIELRHAPFVFWIQDLSVKDPYYITPIIMGVTMFIQQKMNPSTMDPAQAKIFMFMPIVFTFMFLNFPSGLVIYWMVNNLLTILQQWLISRKAEPVAA